MNVYNEENKMNTSSLNEIFQQTLPLVEILEGMYQHSFLFKRDDGFLIKFSVIDYEKDVFVFISKDNQIIITITYQDADRIKILDKKNKALEIISTRSEFNHAASKTILSLGGAPIVQFSDDLDNEKRNMDVVPTDLMLLFDDFDEIQQNESSNKSFRFLCKRFTETAELTIFPGTGKLSLTIKSQGILLHSLNLVNCDRVIADIKKKKLYFSSGFEELRHLSYIECSLDMNEYLFLLVDPNSRPSLRGLS